MINHMRTKKLIDKNPYTDAIKLHGYPLNTDKKGSQKEQSTEFKIGLYILTA